MTGWNLDFNWFSTQQQQQKKKKKKKNQYCKF